MLKLPTIESLTAHIHAQDAALFVLVMLALLVGGIWSGIRSDRKDDQT